VQCESEVDASQDFYFSQCVGTNEDAVRLRCVNGLAEWEDEISVVPVEEITLVEFDTPYLRRFAKYVAPE
jgi:hypothetical protein